jgi:citrate lyase beta subunit
LRHFAHLAPERVGTLFASAPRDITGASAPSLVGSGLGATLYTPATHGGLAKKLAQLVTDVGLTTSVLCLEDAIADGDVPRAEANVVDALDEAAADGLDLPRIFLRVRAPEQIGRLVDALGPALVTMVAGFVLPKFGSENGRRYLDAVDELVPGALVMPILESGAIAYLESRAAELTAVRDLVEEHRGRIPCVRIGGADLSGLFGLRRPADTVIWDLAVVRDVLADIVNVFCRATDPVPISGAVWEHYRPNAIDGLVREVRLDQVNGLCGKTVIHPAHVPIVNAMHTVPFDDHHDATSIIERGLEGGAWAGVESARMNEARPHHHWARRTVLRAQTFGILAPGVSWRDLLRA